VRRFELSEGGSHKFWQIEVAGDSFTVTYGRIGTAGQAQTKAFADAATAEKESEKLVREKVKKGYAEVGGTPAAAPGAASAAAPAAPVASPAPVAPRPPKPKAEPVPVGDGFVPAEGGYSLGIAEGKVVARAPQGKLLASLPKAVKDSPVLTRLEEALEQLEAHEARCAAEVEAWMLRALPVPRAVLESVAQDPAWWGRIQHLVAQAPDGSAGIVRAVDPARGVGVVDLDGETRWLAAASLTFPHPVTLDELDDWRSRCCWSSGCHRARRSSCARPSPARPRTTATGWGASPARSSNPWRWRSTRRVSSACVCAAAARWPGCGSRAARLRPATRSARAIRRTAAGREIWCSWTRSSGSSRWRT
jgi:predicted DNA-binding WGR domain protein